MSQVITRKKKTIADINYILIIQISYKKEFNQQIFFAKKENEASPRVVNAHILLRLIG